MRPELTSFLLKTDPSSLTPNQRKKRRQKLSKQGKSSETSSTSVTATESSNLVQSSLATGSVLYSSAQQAPGASEAASDNVQATNQQPVWTEAQSSQHELCPLGLSPGVAVLASAQSLQVLLPAAPPVCRTDLSGAAALLLQHEPDTVSETHAEAQPKAEQEPSSAGPAGLFVHGNYSSYYSRRFGEDLGDDPRLQVLDRRWFRNKRCMDIGCNDGRLTLTMASKYGCASMLGLDIDASLIKQACRSALLVSACSKAPQPKESSGPPPPPLSGCSPKAQSFTF